MMLYDVSCCVMTVMIEIFDNLCRIWNYGMI